MMSQLPVNQPNPGAKPASALTLRAFRSEDIPAYCTLFQRVFAQAPWNETWTLENISRQLRRNMSKRGFIGITTESQTQVVGFLTGYGLGLPPMAPSIFFLDQLFVDDRCRRIGAGRALLECARSLAADCQYRGMLLLTQAGTAAECFYRENGFKPFLSFLRIKGKILLYQSLR